MNTTLGVVGNLEIHDHNGKLEIVTIGNLDYGELTSQEAATLVSIVAKWLADSLIECQEEVRHG